MTMRLYLAATLAMLLLVGLTLAAQPFPLRAGTAALGCGLAALNGLAAGWINRGAVGPDEIRFWKRAGLGHGLRLALLLLILCAAILMSPDRSVGLVFSLMTGYVCFLAAEIAAVQRRTPHREHQQNA